MVLLPRFRVDASLCPAQVLEFLHRKSDFFKSPGVALDLVSTVARRYADAAARLGIALAVAPETCALRGLHALL